MKLFHIFTQAACMVAWFYLATVNPTSVVAQPAIVLSYFHAIALGAVWVMWMGEE